MVSGEFDPGKKREYGIELTRRLTAAKKHAPEAGGFQFRRLMNLPSHVDGRRCAQCSGPVENRTPPRGCETGG
jgi:hypothetical protein